MKHQSLTVAACSSDNIPVVLRRTRQPATDDNAVTATADAPLNATASSSRSPAPPPPPPPPPQSRPMPRFPEPAPRTRMAQHDRPDRIPGLAPPPNPCYVAIPNTRASSGSSASSASSRMHRPRRVR